MLLVPYTEADLPLTQAIECDERVMKDLGGPMRPQDMPAIHARRLASMARGAWYFKIVPHGGTEAAGTVGLWETTWDGSQTHEMGWMVLPQYQGRGLASGAVAIILDRARAEGGFPHVQAFPGVANAASNAICRKAGFTLLGVCDIEYAGRPLHCNRWRIELI